MSDYEELEEKDKRIEELENLIKDANKYGVVDLCIEIQSLQEQLNSARELIQRADQYMSDDKYYEHDSLCMDIFQWLQDNPIEPKDR